MNKTQTVDVILGLFGAFAVEQLGIHTDGGLKQSKTACIDSKLCKVRGERESVCVCVCVCERVKGTNESISSVESQKPCRPKMFHWEPEGRYWHRLCTAIAPFWFSAEHLWSAVTPFWLSTDDILKRVNLVLKILVRKQFTAWLYILVWRKI